MAKKDMRRPPLTSAMLHILLVLSTGERHGYGIMKQVEADSQGKVNMGPGTLYGSSRSRDGRRAADHSKITGEGQAALFGVSGLLFRHASLAELE